MRINPSLRNRVAALLWRCASLCARGARSLEGLPLLMVQPGKVLEFDFKSDPYWWELCQNREFQTAIQALCDSEEARAIEEMRQYVPVEKFNRVAAFAAAAEVFKGFPRLVLTYAGFYTREHMPVLQKVRK